MQSIIKQARVYNKIYNKVDNIINNSKHDIIHLCINVAYDPLSGCMECINYCINRRTHEVCATFDNDYEYEVINNDVSDVVASIHTNYKFNGNIEYLKYNGVTDTDYQLNSSIHYLYIK